MSARESWVVGRRRLVKSNNDILTDTGAEGSLVFCVSLRCKNGTIGRIAMKIVVDLELAERGAKSSVQESDI